MAVRNVQSVGLSITPDYALRYIVRDMGNGVDRIDSASLLPLEQALTEASLPDRRKILLEPGHRLTTLTDYVISDLGYVTDQSRHCILDGVARTIDDYTIEVLCWCKD